MPNTRCKVCGGPHIRHGYCNVCMPRCYCGAPEYRSKSGVCIKHDPDVPERYRRPKCKCGNELHHGNAKMCDECSAEQLRALKLKKLNRPKCKCGKVLRDGQRECVVCKRSKIHVYKPPPKRKVKCVNGHDYTPENTIHTKRGRRCRTCAREQAKAYEDKNPHRKTAVARAMRRRGAAEVTVKSSGPKPYAYRIDNHAWRVLSRKFKAHSKSRNLGCWMHEYGMCLFDGAPIDYNAIPGTRMAYETDHVKPRSTHPHLMYVWNNLRASHCACNRSRQAKAVVPQGVWVKPSF